MSKEGQTTLPQLSDGQVHDLIQMAGAGPCGMGDISTPYEALLRSEVEEDEEGT